MKFTPQPIVSYSKVAAVILAGIVFIALEFPMTGAIAQGVPELQKSPDEGVTLKDLSPEEIIAYLASEKVVAPGIGFINGQIGDPMNYLLDTWGEPLDQRKTGVLGSIEFLYQPDPATLVVFTGKDTIKTISIKGNSASLLRTRRGARFGYTPSNIFSIYSRFERRIERNRIEYKKLGISFFAVNKRINKIVIFPPKD